MHAAEKEHYRPVGPNWSWLLKVSAFNWVPLNSSTPNWSSGLVTPVATGRATVHADSVSASASTDLTATKLFGVTACCPNNFVILAPSAGNTLPPLPVGDITIGFTSASTTDTVNHRFYVFPVSTTPNGNSFSMVVIDTTTANIVSTQLLSVTLFTAQWDQQTGNIVAITGCCPNQLVSINVTSGNATPIATVGDATNGFNSASAMDQVKHIFYFVRQDANNVTSLLGVDASSGSVVAQFTLRGPIPFLLAWSAKTGNLVGVGGTANPPSNNFVSLDTQTGAETTLGGDLSPQDLQGWTMVSAMDLVRDRFYAIYADLGNGGPARNASLSGPAGITVDPAGNLYIADTSNNRIRKVDTNGVITTFAGNGTAAFAGDGGPASNASLSAPSSVAIDAFGNLYIADTSNNRIRKVDTNGVITTFAGNGTTVFAGDGGPAVNAGLGLPTGIAVDASGNLYIADTTNNCIREVDTIGTITTFAGNRTPGYGGDGGPAVMANLNSPEGVVFDTFGNLYIADTSNNRIRKVDTNGVITTLAGNGTAAYAGDSGSAVTASVHSPSGVALDNAGNLYIADTSNNRIRKVDTNGVITTFAGNGTAAFAGDGGPASSASLTGPSSVVVDKTGILYIGDTVNNRIRNVSGIGVITTAVGNGGNSYQLVGIDASIGTISESLRPPTGAILLGAE
jgi:sugar lactone lactonase YvrE